MIPRADLSSLQKAVVYSFYRLKNLFAVVEAASVLNSILANNLLLALITIFVQPRCTKNYPYGCFATHPAKRPDVDGWFDINPELLEELVTSIALWRTFQVGQLIEPYNERASVSLP